MRIFCGFRDPVPMGFCGLWSSIETFRRGIAHIADDRCETRKKRNNSALSLKEMEVSSDESPAPPPWPRTDGGLEERMRRRLRFFFMNPVEKWRARRKFPYKFVVQLIKIFLVTLQLCLFAHDQYKHVNYSWDNRVAFSHLFLQGWDSAMEVNAYPPGAGPLAVYRIDEFYDAVNYACEGYANLSGAIGAYSYDSEDDAPVAPKLCLLSYKKGDIFGFNESYIFDSDTEETCYDVPADRSECDVRAALEAVRSPVNFGALVEARFAFSVKTVHFKAAGPMTPPDCYRFDVAVLFDNRDHDGQMLLTLDADPVRLTCKGDVEYVTDNRIDAVLHSMLNAFVIAICLASFALCCRAIYRAQQLKKITVHFFRNSLGRELSDEGRFEFLNVWYVMIIVNDVLIVSGSALKQMIENEHFAHDQWNVCSVFLGLGNMLVWFGVLRYLGFFKTYNVVILTLKRAAPKISRFLICALILYAGFTFCGWLVLGPYHMKFRSLAMTSECLFSLINGDDMFATFSSMSGKSPMLWWFSRIYLYSFISLYIYVVLSLFISVIMDAYDTIKRYYVDGFPKNDLQHFIGTVSDDDVTSHLRRSESATSLNVLMKSVICCAGHDRSYTRMDSSGNAGGGRGAICI